MQSPLWIVNNVLALLFAALLLFAFYAPTPLPKRRRLEPETIVSPPTQEGFKVDPARIYQNDLFGTITQPTVEPKQISLVQPLPEPPLIQVSPPPPPPTPQFLDPLKITLRGIMNFGDEAQNRAVIADEADRQRLYGVGDKIDDAYLIRIFENKIVLVRSNGQQETLYLRESDAEADRTLAQMTSFDLIVRKTAENTYSIDPSAFTKVVAVLGELIEALDLSTVLRKGRGFGCRIGTLAQPSLGRALGFQTGDIVRTINGMPVATSEQRLAVYDMVTTLQLGASLEVTLIRQGTPVALHYNLEKLTRMPTVALPTDVLAAQEEQAIERKVGITEEERLALLRKKQTFAPTVLDYKKQEKQMMQRGRRRPLLKNIV